MTQQSYVTGAIVSCGAHCIVWSITLAGQYHWPSFEMEGGMLNEFLPSVGSWVKVSHALYWPISFKCREWFRRPGVTEALLLFIPGGYDGPQTRGKKTDPWATRISLILHWCPHTEAEPQPWGLWYSCKEYGIK